MKEVIGLSMGLLIGVLAFLFQNSILAAITVALVVTYALALMTDVHGAAAHIERASKIASSQGRQRTRNGMMTSAGKRVFDAVLHFLHRENLLRWELEAALLHLQSRPGAPAASEDSRSETGAQRTICDELLSMLPRALRAKSAAVILRSGESSEQIYSSAIRPSWAKALPGILKNYFAPYFELGINDGFGVLDGSSKPSFLSMLSPLGFRYQMAFQIGAGGGPFRDGIVWLGYEEGAPPLDTEVLLVQDAVVRMQEKLSASAEVSRLSKDLAQASKINDVRNEFIAHVSHDIRSPLNNVRSILNLLLLDRTCSDFDELVEVALHNCESVNEIVADLLDFSRHQMGKLSHQPKEVSLFDAAREVFQSYAVMARLKGLEFSIRNEARGGIVKVDPRQFKRVLMNIVGNALKYTRHGSVCVIARVRGNGAASIVIEDSGPGMSEDQLKALFTPFVRFHGSETEGVGLGLALSKIFVELNGGVLKVDSTVGAGSRFEICFPSAQAAEAIVRGESSTVERAPHANDPSPGHRIVVVDDDVDAVNSLARGLESQGHVVFRSFSVHSAKAVCNFEKPDIVITDAEMPEGGGEEVLAFLRKSESLASAIVLTGSDDAELRRRFLQQGVSHVLLKPVDLDMLAQIITPKGPTREVQDEPGWQAA